MAQLNSLVVTGNSKFINDVNANTINLSVNSVGINFRPNNSGYYTTTSYQTSGNEALVFASKNAVTSFMFVNGEDSITNHGDSRWRSLTPGLQVKNNCVSIGQLIDTNVTPTYRLLVNGTTRINEKLTVGSSAQATLPNAGIHVHDVRNVDATPGFLNSAVNFYFTNRTNPYANSPWYSVMHVNGWAGSESYNAWELAGPAHNGDQRTVPLYVRSSNGGTWGSWRQIYDSSNKPDGVKDIGNSTNTTFAYSKTGLNYADYTWLAGWNGYELRAINKNQFAQASHTHRINQITWPAPDNLTTSATANSQEWSIDLNPGTYTGTYFHVWSSKNSKSILQCFTDSNEVVVPSGNLKVTGGKLFVSKTINELLTGTGTAAQDKGSGVSPRYFPVKWTMNVGIATPSDGDMVTIKIPCAGHDFGVFLSLDNGTTYKPIGLKTQDNGRLTTHYPSGRIITLVYDSTAVVDQVFAAAGANSRTNITGAWKVITSYLDGNSNTYDRNLFNGTIKCGTTAIVAANIIVGKDGVYSHLKLGTAFDITYPILYAASNIAANATGTNNYDIIHFTVTTTQSLSLTAYKPVYIKGTLAGTMFTPVSTTPLTQTVPTSDDGYYYIFLGMATAATTIYLQERHPIYVYQNSIIRKITSCSDVARTVQNPTMRVTTPNTHYNDAALRYYLSSNAMTTDKPRNLDGKIIHMPWDNDGGYASQMFVAHGQYALAALRCQNGNKDAWGSWMPMGVFSQTTPTSGQVVITDGTNGMIKSSGYTIATSVPSGAVFTDTKNTAGSTDTSSKIFLIGATSQAANPQTYSDNEVFVTSGTLQTKVTQASSTICANTANSSTAGGLSLYATDPTVYGVIFRGTGNQGTHGYVTSDWATYFTMSNSDNRGWVFRRNSSGNVASIDTKGRMVLNGSVTVGNTTNGGRMEYNSTNHCIDFIVT